MQKYVNDARIVFSALNGIFIVYKPADLAFIQARSTVLSNLCADLNNLRVRPPKKHISIVGPTNKPMKVLIHNSYADHTLVVGPRYQIQDFKLATTNLIEREACGVMVFGINAGIKIIHKMRINKCTRFYRVKGLLGQATNNYFHTGKIVEKSTYKHVKRGHIDKLCSAMQSSHQKKMFELCGVDIQSQAAYELAVQGLLRPVNSKIPMIYTIKCVDFTPPEFTLEIVSINEDAMYLKTIIHDLGMQLHSTATCTQIQCIQDGLFNITHALLKKHWTLKHIMENMQMCQNILNENPDILYQKSPALVERDNDTFNEPSNKISTFI
ncbi:pseudouridylate synthase TRUB2, mitochondrial [Calliopsis andreniformis]|uniref:pseudouridylate synthase TRUB2, mitochondrial n=1 Tax=Calliopsis andreniformis TaxID=337506 RepID=UPI003FCCFE4E